MASRRSRTGPAALLAAGLTLALLALGWRLAAGADTPRPGQTVAAARPSSASADAPLRSRASGLVEPLVEESGPPARRSASDPPPAGLVVHLRAADTRAPLAGAEALFADGSGRLERARCDAQGACRFDLAPPGVLVVREPGCYPARAELAAGPAQRELLLPAGGTLRGDVLLDGEPPASPLRLRVLHARGSLFDVPLEEPAIAEFLSARGASEELWIDTDERGRFELRRLPEGWKGWLVPPDPWVVEQPRAALSGLVGAGLAVDDRGGEASLRLVRPIELSGRVLRPGGLVPVTDTTVIARAFFGESAWSYASAPTDASGVFRLALPELPARVQLTLGSGVEADVPRTTFAQSGTLGDFFLPGGRTLTLRVLDLDGVPIARATATARGASAHGDENGEVVLAGLPEAEVELVVSSREHRSLALALPAGGDEAREVVLERANALTIALAEPALFPAGFGVRLGGSVVGAPPQARGRWEQRSALPGAVILWASAGRDVTVHDVRAGVAIPLALEDPYGNVVLETELAPLGAAETRTEVLRPTVAPLDLSGVVRDEAGRPVLGADVTIASELLRTDAHGRFVVAAFCGRTVDLEVTKPGYASALVRAWPVAEPLAIELEAERDLVVRVASPGGRTLSEATLRARAPGGERSWSSVPGGDGTWRFEGLPARALVLALALDGRELEEPIGGQVTRWTFLVPEWSEVSIDLAGLEALEGSAAAPGAAVRELALRSLASGALRDRQRAVGVVALDAADGASAASRIGPDGAAALVLRLFEGSYELHAWSAARSTDASGAGDLQLVDLAARIEVRGGEPLRASVRGASLVVTGS